MRRLYDANDDAVLVAAHRGDWRNAPENSLQAIENAIAMGCDIVEIDIRMTKDRRFVVMHDKTLDRTTTGSGKISHQTLAEIQQLRLRNGYGLPTEHRAPSLEEAFEVARGRAVLYIDKSEHCIADVYRLAAKVGVNEQTLFYGHMSRAEIRKGLGDLADRVHYLPKVGENTANAEEYVSEHLRDANRPVFLVSFKDGDATVLEQTPVIRGAGRRVWMSPLWPDLCAGRTDDLAVDDPEGSWGWLIDRGASVLCTDRPAQLLAYLRSKRLHD
ncbi:putative glycerophosphoryl diester phosphodiesterase 1 [Planctomycetes bacterium MalM25]|nr:putative glycerophosphoryl diester phosphodiesterase 1 [Planctomycetes bacterium MalM25]